MEFDLSPHVAAAQVDLAWGVGAHLLLRETGGDAKGRAGTALALPAMARKRSSPFHTLNQLVIVAAFGSNQLAIR
jgi:hypothetical protein